MHSNRTALATGLALALLAGAAAAPSSARAQDDDIFGPDLTAGYAGTIFTAVGAFVPSATPLMMRGSAAPGGVVVRGHYGFQSGSGRSNFNNYGVGLDFTAGSNMLGVTLGQLRPDCPGDDDEEGPCDAHFTFGLGWERGLLDATLGSTGARLTAGADAMLGYARPGDESPLSDGGSTSIFSLGLGMPIALTSGGPGLVHFTPFLRPGIAYGRVRSEADPDFGGEDFNETGAVFTLGGGLGISGLAPGLTVSVGAQHYMTVFSTTTVGIGVSLTGLSSPRTRAAR
ncbi:MAG TPA: hypothetical protein VKA84_03845 [Gemmatimonadaceae bacterium]|nr:hypothetical protein [Gemmatimonadaceae bacterium]